MSLAQSFGNRNVWLRWAGRVRELVELRLCLADDGSIDDPEGCLLFHGHPGEHTFVPGGSPTAARPHRRCDASWTTFSPRNSPGPALPRPWRCSACAPSGSGELVSPTVGSVAAGAGHTVILFRRKGRKTDLTPVLSQVRALLEPLLEGRAPARMRGGRSTPETHRAIPSPQAIATMSGRACLSM
ncbi:hypothetical protein AB0G15_22845 [Streptosporangium sp. NPDC023825]|uniref:hypothetical protein n=1 Tax=Streptosporangium sp. NPDC023825 TaxID=3154909 RepID=UPI003414E477